MKVTTLPFILDYDGSQIEPLWAYSMGIEGDSIVLFRGAMDIPPSNIKDLEDFRDNKAIRGGDMLHFIVERFSSSASIRSAYYLQRLLVVCAKEALAEHEIQPVRSGDDIFVEGGKLSVSIASAGISSEKVHLGINISCKGTPSNVRVTCLEDLGINDTMGLGEQIAGMFVREMEEIEADIVKTRGL